MAHLTVSVDGYSRPRYYLPTICCGPVGNSLSRLNIQAASVVVLCEPQFKPSIENQTISRAYRMGQTRKVFVHRLLCTGTIDERIMQILANKQRIFDAFADRSVAAEQVDQAFSRKTMDQIVRDELRKYAGAR